MREQGKWEADMLAQQDQPDLQRPGGEVLEELGLKPKLVTVATVLCSYHI